MTTGLPPDRPTAPRANVLYLAAYVALVVITAGLPLGLWSRPRRPGRRGDRQLLRLIRHERRTAR